MGELDCRLSHGDPAAREGGSGRRLQEVAATEEACRPAQDGIGRGTVRDSGCSTWGEQEDRPEHGADCRDALHGRRLASALPTKAVVAAAAYTMARAATSGW
ncbi:hypothetical protein JCM18899A_29560 [Nocardioides sp. AN3]